MKEALATALLWISQNTAYEIPQTRPSVVIEDHVAIAHLQAVDHHDFFGLYDRDFDRIWLSRRVDLDAPAGRAKLVHELIHWLQDEAPVRDDYACWGEREFEAYHHQARYAEDHGVDPGINWAWVRFQYGCPPPFAPDHTRP